MEVPARQMESDLWLIDLGFQGTRGVVAAYLIPGTQGHTLIETGPGSTVAALEYGVRSAGIEFDEITQLVITHIHLDHAGAAGSLLRRLPQARLFVHPAGVAHMIDPSKLIASAARIYGDRMDALWGAFEPCPADRVTVLQDNAELRCGHRTLVALHTPGHASHHIAFHDPERHTVFTGDVGGVRLQGASFVRPPTPPPDIDVEAWHTSVDRLRATGARALDLTHFGRFTDPMPHFDELLRRLDEWTRWAAERIAAGETADAMTTELKRRCDDEVERETGDTSFATAYELATPSRMTVDGLARYLKRRSAA